MDARNWSRVIVEKEVAVGLAGKQVRGFLYDLCEGGCMIEIAALDGAPDNRLSIQLYDRETVAGDIVWRVGHCAGVRFDTPIHDAVVRHIGFVPPPIPIESREPRDRFGRILPPIDAGDRCRR